MDSKTDSKNILKKMLIKNKVYGNMTHAGKNFSWLVKVLKKWREAGLLLAALGIVMLIREVSGIGCPFQWLTGISCAGCGMTRAVLCAVRFQFGEAFYYHPLFWVIPFGAVLFCFREKIPARYRKGLAWITVVCFGAVYLVRLFFSDHQVVVAEIGRAHV